jgi:hypothetical protein
MVDFQKLVKAEERTLKKLARSTTEPMKKYSEDLCDLLRMEDR